MMTWKSPQWLFAERLIAAIPESEHEELETRLYSSGEPEYIVHDAFWAAQEYSFPIPAEMLEEAKKLWPLDDMNEQDREFYEESYRSIVTTDSSPR